ncbi:sec-independent protein translocase protein TatA [Flavobacterium fluvii]|uniref:Sec-independent protein translocase protein TatA n=1 Tax=Flavobacterium fluvii TaxID=468056 RepID=A0A1M5G4Y9_9FLAO|nr:twin-arginine translocase TatA/TatE family subunit [Flavobacterium fluvii]SHF98778.1 sec-independent protein translocase protein TatA [Flavobacterium fluvii]
MFGIGGGELIFILFVILMLFGSDKVPEIARTMGKAMAQLKNATNDIKNEIQKGAEDNGLDQKTLNNFTGNITSEINSAKANLLGDTNPLSGISDAVSNEIDKTKSSILDNTIPQVDKVAGEIEGIVEGPIKRKM